MLMKLDELAKQAGVAARTVRYYVQRGLLPAPVFRGKDTAYSDEHLTRLRAIRKLQDRFLPLDAIHVELQRLSIAELEALVAATEPPAVPPTVLLGGPVPVSVPRPPARHPYRQAEARKPGPGATLTRWRLAPGLELTLADDADDEARALADAIHELVRTK